MIFKFLQRPIVLDCFTVSSNTFSRAPIDWAIKKPPKWWAKLPNSYMSNDSVVTRPCPTMKKCYGFIDYYANSLAVPLWSDVVIKTLDKKVFWQFSDGSSEIASHDKNQYEGYVDDTYVHIKFISPWIFKCSADINWLLTEPTYDSTALDKYRVMPGAVNFYRQRECNVQFMVNVLEDMDFVLPFKRPIGLLTPITERKVIIRKHLIPQSEFDNMRQETANRVTFTNMYKSNQLAKKVACPFKK
jgi:hypothetical protein